MTKKQLKEALYELILGLVLLYVGISLIQGYIDLAIKGILTELWWIAIPLFGTMMTLLAHHYISRD